MCSIILMAIELTGLAAPGEALKNHESTECRGAQRVSDVLFPAFSFLMMGHGEDCASTWLDQAAHRSDLSYALPRDLRTHDLIM